MQRIKDEKFLHPCRPRVDGTGVDLPWISKSKIKSEGLRIKKSSIL
jgi:hypothetical protein